MAGELGTRLLRAGVITGRQLAEARAAGAPSSGRLVAALCAAGAWDDAIAGYLMAHGYGPLVHPTGTGAVPSALPADAARELHVLPVGRRGSAWIIAMADPSDSQALDRLRKLTGTDVTPALSRSGELEEAIRAAYVPEGDAPPEPEATSAPSAETEAQAPEPVAGMDEEAAPLELVRKRVEPARNAADTAGAHPADRPGPEPGAGLGSEPASAEEPAPSTTGEEVVPLVRPRAAAPEPVPPEQDSWQAPSSDRPPPDMGPLLEAIGAATDRDTIVARACEAALGVCRQAVFLAVRKNVLRGFAGKGEGIDDVSLRNLWVPVDDVSHLGRVANHGEDHDGSLQDAGADAVFKAATGAQGTRSVLEPVKVRDRTVGVLAADEVGFGTEGADRIREIAQAVGDGFLRLLMEAKRG